MITLLEAGIGFLIAAVVGIGLALIITYSASAGSVIMNSLVARQCHAEGRRRADPHHLARPRGGVEVSPWRSCCRSSRSSSTRPRLDRCPERPAQPLQLMQASPFQVFRKVRLPSAMPAIFDGFKIALPIAHDRRRRRRVRGGAVRASATRSSSRTPTSTPTSCSPRSSRSPRWRRCCSRCWSSSRIGSSSGGRRSRSSRQAPADFAGDRMITRRGTSSLLLAALVGLLMLAGCGDAGGSMSAAVAVPTGLAR